VFTGIVECMGRIARLHAVAGRVDLELEVPAEFAAGLAIGASVAVDGCCLTVTTNELEPGGSAARLGYVAIPETLQRTSLGAKQVGQHVNLERALAANGRLDGHLVQGHIDDVGVVSAFLRDGSDVRLHVRCPSALARLLVPKGSVAIDGVSLTVVETAPEGFFVSLIPHTLEVTTLGERQPGDPVNLEADVIGKYVHYYLSRMGIHASE
jgi:riboflavin synthase